MKNVIIKLFGSVAALLIGISMLGDILTDVDAELGARLFVGGYSLIIIIFGIVLAKQGIDDARWFRFASRGKRASDVIKNEISATLLPDFASVGDQDATQKLLSSFRENYRNFFKDEGRQENARIQNDVTQIFRNILELQRLRLKRKNVDLDFSSERKQYGKSPVSIKKEFDGKYEIQEINEDIAAKNVFTSGGRTIFKRISAETAHYTVINAKQLGKGAIICPNCGVKTDRVSLLDGCDYCKTKFSVEDLGKKISDFSLRRNEKVEYQKYAAFRNKLNLWVGIITGLISGVYSGYWTVVLAVEDLQTGENPFLVVLVSAFAVLIATSLAVFLAILFFDLFVLPWIQAGATARYLVKRMKSKRKESRDREAAICIDKIREFDALFSFANFCSSLTNKLATIIFADTKIQAEAFFESVEKSDVQRYKDVIDMDVLDIEPVDYKIQNGMQHLLVRTELVLVEYNGRKCRQRPERLLIHLEKTEGCKTQAICAPSLMTCKGCGVSRSILDGKTCPQCGREINIRNYDWIISKMEYVRREN